MARAPNYSFERKERDRLKAAKTAEKNKARRGQRDMDTPPSDPPGDDPAPDKA